MTQTRMQIIQEASQAWITAAEEAAHAPKEERAEAQDKARAAAGMYLVARLLFEEAK